MNLALKYSAAIIAVAVLLMVIGLNAGLSLPNSLLPKIDQPEIRLRTFWPGKTSEEIEQTLIAPLESQLKGISSLKNMQSLVFNSNAWTFLFFHPGTDMDKVYMDLLSRVNQVPSWPAEVAAPDIQNFSNGAGLTLASFFLYSENSKTAEEFIHVFKSHIEPVLMEIKGIAGIALDHNPIKKRVDIEFDSKKMAQYSLSIPQVTARLRELKDSSGDTLTLGAREYGLHFNGKYNLSTLGTLPIHAYNDKIIRLTDIATIETVIENDWGYVGSNGKQAFSFSVKPVTDINVLETLNTIKLEMEKLNRGPLAELSMGVKINRDDSTAIKSALTLVYYSLLLGIVLAWGVLFYFLRNARIVLLVMLSVPVCLSIVVIALQISGRSINMISLAGMALSVGLLIDAAIIVVENIQRLRSEGKNIADSIKLGVAQVNGALISSTLSSVVVFMPILMMHSNEGQLFEDLAFTISSALLGSLLVAIFLLPAIARYILPDTAKEVSQVGRENLWAAKLSLPAKSKASAVIIALVGIPVALFVTFYAAPALDVLPNPKQKTIDVYINTYESLSMSAVESEIAQVVEQRIRQEKEKGTAPEYRSHGMLCFPGYCHLFFNPGDELDFTHFESWIYENITKDLISADAYVMQGRLLHYAMPNSRNLQLDLKGASLEVLQQQGLALLAHLKAQFPQAQISADSALENSLARIEFTPNDEQLIYLGLSRAELNAHLVALTYGSYLGQFYADGETLPFYLKGKTVDNLTELLQSQLMITGHGLIPLSSLVDAKFGLSPGSIFRSNGDIGMVFSVNPPADVAVAAFAKQVKTSVNAFLQASLVAELYVHYRGSSDQLNGFLQEFTQIFLFALLILTVMMWLTLSSWRLAMAVIVSMPLAFAGGMLTLQLLRVFVPQTLDVITMLGFVILMGLVINNAILLVSQFQSGLQKGLSQYQAILGAVKIRKRPIYMSTSTTIFGMLPLILIPGQGAEIYRGLAAVIVGGMAFSLLFSMSFMSALLSLGIFNINSQTRNP
jgi:HAE1 family hydrophobic/amphiphilic exporter-1